METIDEIEKLIENEMNRAHTFYSSHVTGPRISFRILGLATLFLSVTIPFISQKELEIANKELLITGLSLSLTVVAGILTFFKPDETWKLNMSSRLNLESLFAFWKLEMIEAKSISEPVSSTKSAVIVSKKFLVAAQAVTAANSHGFFANITLPAAK